MKILGIDPGYERMGVAVLEKNKIIFSDCVRTSAKLAMADRLVEIGNALEVIIKKYKPDVVAIESLYFSKNTKTAMLVAETRGVIQYIMKKNGLAIFEYHPNTIKLAVTGNGSATKEGVAIMVPKLIQLDAKKKIDDELDAIAIAITHSVHARSYPQNNFTK